MWKLKTGRQREIKKERVKAREKEINKERKRERDVDRERKVRNGWKEK